jgi:hypothetical protein
VAGADPTGGGVAGAGAAGAGGDGTAGTDGVGAVGSEGAGGRGDGEGEGAGGGGGAGGFGIGGGGRGRLTEGTETVGTGGKPTWASARAESAPAIAVVARSAAAPALDLIFMRPVR